MRLHDWCWSSCGEVVYCRHDDKPDSRAEDHAIIPVAFGLFQFHEDGTANYHTETKGKDGVHGVPSENWFLFGSDRHIVGSHNTNC